MIKHLLLTLMLLLNSSIVLAQFDNISIIGQFTNWAADVPMATEDGVIYTLSSQNFAVSGGAKFRKDNMWDTNWGATTFPTGTATQGGQDIPVPMGTYDVEFNKETGTYIFTEVASEFDNIGIIGGFNSWAESEQMVTFDGSLYTLDDYYFSADEVKFRKDNNWDANWGGSTFPSGEAIANGNNIPLVAGFYNVAFNYSGLNYSFIQVPVSLIGDGAQGWETDIALPSSDGGVTFLMQNFELVDGFVKFRANSSWAKNWGSSDFPMGTGTQNGMDIPTVAGIYNISFNRITGEYNFEEVLSVNDPLKVSAKVYPNPTQNNWTFVLENNQIESIDIVDMTGKTVYSNQFNSNEVLVDATNFSTGIYFAKVRTGEAVQTIKLVRK